VKITIAPRAPEKELNSESTALIPGKAPLPRAAQTQTWEDRYNEIKIAHPRAYEEWTPFEEAKFIELFQNRTPIRSIADALDRQHDGVRARLIRLKVLEPTKGKAAVGI
jgi:hypothetical protein